MSRLIMVVGHTPSGLNALETRDVGKKYGDSDFEYRLFDPSDEVQHHENVLRHRPKAVIMLRQGLGVWTPLPFMPRADTRRLAPHVRFLYERDGRRLVIVEPKRSLRALTRTA